MSNAIPSADKDLSRLLLIPFNLPKIGGTSEEDCVNFQKLGNLKKLASSCIGWAISLGKKFEERGVSEINTTMLPMIYPQLKGLDPRFITGYSILLYFVKEMISEANLTAISLVDVADFIGNNVPAVLQRKVSPDQLSVVGEGSCMPPIIQQVLENVVQWASQKSKFEILRCLRTGVKDKSQTCVALRLCTLAGPLNFDEYQVSEIIRRSNCGRTNVVKDFLSPNSTDSFVKRNVNHVSSRAAIIYTSYISEPLLKQLQRVCQSGSETGNQAGNQVNQQGVESPGEIAKGEGDTIRNPSDESVKGNYKSQSKNSTKEDSNGEGRKHITLSDDPEDNGHPTKQICLSD